MKKFTKMFMTLALLCVAGVVSAQDWEELPVTAWMHEFHEGVEAQIDAAANYDDNTGAYVVHVRSEETARAAGNAILDNGNFAPWDSQFFITVGEENAFAEGDKIRVVFSYMGSENVNGVETQSHKAPGGYIHWACIGNINFAKDQWQDFDQTFEVGDAPRTDFYTIAFNLAKGAAYDAYFKDIKIYKQKPAPVNPEEPMPEPAAIPDGWKDISGNAGVKFWVHEWRDMAAQTDGEALTDNDGCIVVARSNAEAYEAGNGTTTNGEPLAEDYSNFADWDSQFFIDFGEENIMEENQKFMIRMTVKADENASIGTQAHAAPGAYQHYAAIGNVSFKQGWTNWDSGEVTVSAAMAKGNNGNGEGVGMRSIAFNLGKGPHNVFHIAQIQILVPDEGGEQPPVEEYIIPELPADFVLLDASIFKQYDLQATEDFGADALPESDVQVDWIVDGEGKKTTTGMIAGTSQVTPYVFADLSAYEMLMIVCGKVDKGDAAASVRANAVSPEGLQFRVMYNRSIERKADDSDWVAVDQLIAESDASGYASIDITKGVSGEPLDFFHLNAIKTQWGMPELRVFAIMAKDKPATGIKDINVNDGNKGIYDLNGRRVNLVNKGIYIIDGKKVIF